MKVQRPEELLVEKILGIAKRYRAIYVSFEPLPSTQSGTGGQALLEKYGFGLSKSTFLPTKSLELDLAKSNKYFYRNLKKDCRYALRKCEEQNIECKMGIEIKEFRDTWKKSVPVGRYVMSERNMKSMKAAFGKKMQLIATTDLSAGGIFLTANKRACYWMGFSNREGRKTQAQYKVVWEGILWAKKMGGTIFDFDGIYDERMPIETWKGLTHFKKSFGGEEVYYPGAYSKWIWKFW